MDAYIAPALLAYFVTGWSAVMADRRLDPVDAPAYVYNPRMCFIIALLWPFFKPATISFFLIVFGVEYVLYMVASGVFDAVFWRVLVTGLVALPILAISAPLLTIVAMPFVLVFASLLSVFSRKR